jgi:hypothetical protein
MIGSNQKKKFGFQSMKDWELKSVLCKGEEKWIYRWDSRGNRCKWCRLWVTFSPCLSQNAPPYVEDETSEASNLGKDIEWIWDSRKVKSERWKLKKRENLQFEDYLSVVIAAVLRMTTFRPCLVQKNFSIHSPSCSLKNSFISLVFPKWLFLLLKTILIWMLCLMHNQKSCAHHSYLKKVISRLMTLWC